jgi:putative Ca2+/H+ antiporter (TMEM165/GDT1 family)
MDALLNTLIAVFFAEMGDRSQILVAALAIRFRDDKSVLAGLSVATILNCSIAAFAGSLVDQWVSQEPVKLFTALAYIFAGVGMLLWRRKVDLLENWKLSAFTTSFLGLFILQFGDKSQFLIAVGAANTPFWGFALAGGILGVMAASVPAIFLRERLAQLVPLPQIRWIAGGAMLLWGAFLALAAFKLV